MKALASLLILSCIGHAQEPPKGKIIPFSQTDKEHCQVVMNEGKPMLQTTYNGTSVAVALPEKNSHGFSVFVRVTQEGKGKVEVVPEKVTAIYSDPDHTRFEFFDMTREWEKAQKDELKSQKNDLKSQTYRPGSSAITTASSQTDSQPAGTPPPNTVTAKMPDGTTWSSSPTLKVEDGSSRWSSEGGGSPLPRTSPPHETPFLSRTVLHQFYEADGEVCLQKPKESKVELSSTGTLTQIDIPIGDVTFRF
jgi:hypothetical protein